MDLAEPEFFLVRPRNRVFVWDGCKKQTLDGRRCQKSDQTFVTLMEKNSRMESRTVLVMGLRIELENQMLRNNSHLSDSDRCEFFLIFDLLADVAKRTVLSLRKTCAEVVAKKGAAPRLRCLPN